MSKTSYDFDELKSKVRDLGLLERVPVRGSIEMTAILLSMGLVYVMLFYHKNLIDNSFTAAVGLGLFMVLVFTRAVFVSHDILHTQYFKNKRLSFKLSYPFSAFILSNSSSWWDFKHNVNHHTWCNIVQKDVDILAFDGAFTNKKGNKTWLRRSKYLVFWGAMFFMYPAFIVQSYNFALKRKKWAELGLMLLHWPLVWGPVFYFLPLSEALTVYLTLNLTLSVWLAFGFITNHLGCEVFDKEVGEKLSWMELQMRTSRSLKGGKFVHWFYGGLNTQIEHHLFPKAPRFNLLKIQKMTKEFAQKNGIAYFETTPLQAYIQINNVLKSY
ncbi:acyl-CoA desaturase [Sulfurimonas sp. SWIR-19]|uniref:acyl-CoA desaturase n=1 Tax=Sulfurimonas sp. SWIR-19 TaxID=2878390 RepID=UPI001CF33456|nr:acyl-CoA desaturase [Sulfurimonas sp. SWIR-19]UCM99952.1 acyl-CoA desaturase [Sulfurimonas sp. SWIR-19]